MNTPHFHWWIAAADWQDCLSAGCLMAFQLLCIPRRLWITHTDSHKHASKHKESFKTAPHQITALLGQTTARKIVAINRKRKLNNPSVFLQVAFSSRVHLSNLKLFNDSKVVCGHSKPHKRHTRARTHTTQFLTAVNLSWITEAVKTVSLLFQVGDRCSCTAYKQSRAMTGNHYYSRVSIWVTDHSIKAHSSDLCIL